MKLSGSPQEMPSPETCNCQLQALFHTLAKVLDLYHDHDIMILVEQHAVLSIDQLLDLGTASNYFLDLYIYVDDEIKSLP